MNSKFCIVETLDETTCYPNQMDFLNLPYKQSYSKSKTVTLFFAVLHKFVKCDIKLNNTTPFCFPPKTRYCHNYYFSNISTVSESTKAQGKNRNAHWMSYVLIKGPLLSCAESPAVYQHFTRKMPNVLWKERHDWGIFSWERGICSHMFANLRYSPFFVTNLKTAAYC